MPKYLLVYGYSTGASQAFALTRYCSPCGGYVGTVSDEANVQLIARDSYTLSNLFVRVITNTLDNSTTVRSRIGGFDGNQSVSIGTGATGAFTDAVSTDSLVDGNLFCSSSVTGGTVGSIIFTVLSSYILETAVNTTPILAVKSTVGQSSVQAAATYMPIGGYKYTITTETEARYKFRVSATLSNLRAYVSSNTLDNTAWIRTRKNGANGNQVVTMLAGATGVFEDTTNTDSIAVGNNVNYRIDTSATTGTITVTSIQVKSNSAGRQLCFLNCRVGYGIVSFGSTKYGIVEGAPGTSYATTEVNVQVTARVIFWAKNGYVNTQTNTVNNSSTFRMRKNGINGNLLVSVPAASTGQFEDIANTDSFIATDLLNWMVITGGIAGSITINVLGFELAQPIAAGGLKMVPSLKGHMGYDLKTRGGKARRRIF